MFTVRQCSRAEALAQTWKLSENWDIRSEGTAMRRTSRIQIQLEGLWNVTHLGRGSKLMQNLSHSTSMVYLPTIYRRNYPSYRYINIILMEYPGMFILRDFLEIIRAFMCFVCVTFQKNHTRTWIGTLEAPPRRRVSWAWRLILCLGQRNN